MTWSETVWALGFAGVVILIALVVVGRRDDPPLPPDDPRIWPPDPNS